MYGLKTVLSIFIVAIALILSIYNEHLITTLKNVFFKSLSTTTTTTSTTTSTLLTASQLKQFNGVDHTELYLAILGKIYDVTKGKKHYGPGETYNVFVGRDASRSFVTGKFNLKDLSDDITGLSNEDLRSLSHWMQFYKREYTAIGKLIGRYYDENGKPTQYNKEIKKLIKLAESEKEAEALEKLKYPPCNVEWSAEHGSRVWCTRRSGGIERNWVGVPRKLYEPGSESHRCACINDENKYSSNIREYEGCNPNFDSCYVKA